MTIMDKKKFNKKHDDLMKLLHQVPGVKEHMERFEMKMGIEVFRRRVELGLTQAELVEMINQNGEKITQATISKVERGEINVSSDTYNKIFNALGGIDDVDFSFSDCPKSMKRELVFA